jgi:ATP-dependent DNA ligase
MSDLKFMLAKEFMKGGKEDVTGWLISEKFDGYRACYDHDKKHFFSRQNKPFNAPEWFIQAMPPRLIDGELWIGRDMFQEMGTVRKKIPVDEEWFNITFQVYDMPDHPGPFVERLKELKRIVKLTKERWNLRRKDYEYPYNKMACPVVVAKRYPPRVCLSNDY